MSKDNEDSFAGSSLEDKICNDDCCQGCFDKLPTRDYGPTLTTVMPFSHTHGVRVLDMPLSKCSKCGSYRFCTINGMRRRKHAWARGIYEAELFTGCAFSLCLSLYLCGTHWLGGNRDEALAQLKALGISSRAARETGLDPYGSTEVWEKMRNSIFRYTEECAPSPDFKKLEPLMHEVIALKDADPQEDWTKKD